MANKMSVQLRLRESTRFELIQEAEAKKVFEPRHQFHRDETLVDIEELALVEARNTANIAFELGLQDDPVH